MRPGILGIKKVLHPKHLLRLGKTFISKGAAALLLIDLVITFRIDAVFAGSAARAALQPPERPADISPGDAQLDPK